ncbi:hypothetical protein Tco_1241685, partial [Tanacetum coccineum]
SLQTEKKVPQGKKPRAKTRLRRKQSSKHTSESNSEASNFQVGQIGKENLSNTAMDSNLSQPSDSTPVDTELHKEVQQAAGGATSLGVTGEEGAHPQLSSGNDASADFTAEADPKIFAPNDSIPYKQGPDKGSKNYIPNLTFAGNNLSVLVDKTKSTGDGSQTAHTVSGTKVDTRSAFMDDEDEPFIALEESNEEHAERNKDTHNQKLEQDKEKVSAKIATLKAHCSIPTELKELPTKITALSGEVNELKKHIKEFEVELPEIFNEIPQKHETFSSTVSSLTTQVAELRKHKWELPKEFASILNAHNKGVPLVGKLTTSHTKGEKNTNPVTENAELANLVDLIGIDVVKEYLNKKLLYNKYCDKMLKRKKNPKITNCEVLTKKGPITLKIYREDGFEEVISNLKVSDLHLAEWREVIQVFSDKSEKGWKTIYVLVKTRLDQLTQTEQELKIDLNKPLKVQDPLNELNELANKKRKRASEFSDEPRSTKKVKSSVRQ